MDEIANQACVASPYGRSPSCLDESGSRDAETSVIRVPGIRPRTGLTLFEVSISLVIIAFGVVSVLMLIPTGIKAQQMARFQILASVRAMELIDAFSTVNGGNQFIEREGPYPWDVSTSYRAYAHDFEIALGTQRYGLMPLPMDIAKRLDSDGDEIQRILSEGGYLYYSNPMAVGSLNHLAVVKNAPLPNETRRMICAVSGYAQQNAIPAFSYKDWPYYAQYPSPPMHLQVGPWGNLRTSLPTAPYGVIAFGGDPSWSANSNLNIMLWENTLEADQGEIGVVFRSVVKGPDLPETTKWVEACESGGSLETAKNHLGHFYRRESGYLACCDQYGWIPDPFLINLPSSYTRPPVGPAWPAGYTANWQWRQYGPDTGKVFTYSRLGVPETKDMTTEMRDSVQPPVLPDGAGGTAVNPVAGVPNAVLAKESALAYFALARWYAREKGVSTAIQDGMPLADNGSLLAQSTLFESGSEPAALAVNAARILGHAAMVLSGHLTPNSYGESFSLGECEVYLEGTYPFRLSFSPNSNAIPPIPGSRPTLTRIMTGIPNIRYDKTPAFSGIDLNKIKVYVDNATKLGMRFAATFPYDWGSPRPLNRAIMMDNPLLQYDMFDSGMITTTSVPTPFSRYAYGQRPSSSRYGTPAKSPSQWRIASAQPIVNLGRSQSYPSMDLTSMSAGFMTNQSSGSGGDPRRFTLARPFQPAERTRELVFWAVDWQSYEDFETAPSAPVDASRHPKLAPVETSTSASNFGTMFGSASAPAASPAVLIRNNQVSVFHMRHQPAARNPEKLLAFLGPTDNIATGNNRMYVGGVDEGLTFGFSNRPDHPLYVRIDTNVIPAGPPLPPPASAMVFSGQFGADRNTDGMTLKMDANNPTWIKGYYATLDRGPVPRSVRLRATTIARFNFYDPRIPVVAR